MTNNLQSRTWPELWYLIREAETEDEIRATQEELKRRTRPEPRMDSPEGMDDARLVWIECATDDARMNIQPSIRVALNELLTEVRRLRRLGASGVDVPVPTHLNAEQLRTIRAKIADGGAGQYEAALLLQHVDSIPAEFYRAKWNEEQLEGMLEQRKAGASGVDVEGLAHNIAHAIYTRDRSITEFIPNDFSTLVTDEWQKIIAAEIRKHIAQPAAPKEEK